MSIYKHEHTDGSGNFFLYLYARLFRWACRSVVQDYQEGPLHCTLPRYHSEKHHDETAKVQWAYGDEFFAD
jgi:hypothetical protein